jgi:capsular exopolysaccharide synthesis family protein
MSRLTKALKRVSQELESGAQANGATGDSRWGPYAKRSAAPQVDYDDMFRSEAELEPDAFSPRTLDSTTLSRLVIGPTMEQEALEQYRKLAASLHQVQQQRGLRAIMVASAVAGEGKTLTAVNLALTFSESYRRRVLLVDGDLRRPSIHELLHVPADSSGAEFSVRRIMPRLSTLTATTPVPDPIRSLASPAMRDTLLDAAANFDWIIIDTPPVALLPDAKLLADMADGIVLVIGAAQAPHRWVHQAVESLGRDRIIGTVLNRVETDPATAGYEYYMKHYTSVKYDPARPDAASAGARTGAAPVPSPSAKSTGAEAARD